MNSRFVTAIYDHSPVVLQNVFCSIMGYKIQRERYGSEFDRWAEFYAQSRSWSHSELAEYQREQLQQLISECFESVPYYAQTWREAGLSPGDLKDVSDLQKWPCTTKEDIVSAGQQRISSKVDRRSLIHHLTGGSTGTPMSLYFTASELRRHYAIYWDRMRPGVRRGDRYAAFQGKEVVPASQARPPYWRENYVANQRLYSMRHLSPAKLQAYAESLMAEPFVYYQGYTSFMAIVAEYMDEHRLTLPTPPKAVFCTSEQLSTVDRQLLERAWNTRVWDEYCQSEACAMIFECEYGNRHVQMEYGIVEWEPIGREGDWLLAEMICTGFIPHAAPFVRYRIGDRVVIDEGAACPCGRLGPVIKAIRGRVKEYILTPDGRKYPTVGMIVDLLRNVRRTQVVQERPEEIIVRVVKFPDYSQQDERHLMDCFKQGIGGGIGVKVEYVTELERLPNGKVMSIINRIPGHGRAYRATGD